MISSCKCFDLRTDTEKNNSEPRQEKEMKYCINCFYARIKYRAETGYYCWCEKHKKETGFYKRCQEHK